MTSTNAVAFDGTPVHGGAGMREPILAQPRGGFSRPGGGRLTHKELEGLVNGEYVTPLTPALASTTADPVVVYRHRDFFSSGLQLECFDFSRQGEIHVALVGRNSATKLLGSFAGAAALAAWSALKSRRFDEVRTFSRRGLMVVPELRDSPLAAELYGLLVAAQVLSDGPSSMRKEIQLMLDANVLPRVWETVAAALKNPRGASSGARRIERELEVGTGTSPRRAA